MSTTSLVTRNLEDYEWDYDTGLASFSYEDPTTGEKTTTYRQQMTYWVPPRWRVPVSGGFNDPRNS